MTNLDLERLTIAEVLNRWPQTIPVFLEYRLDCVGCDMAQFETLADVIEIYHLQARPFLTDLVRTMQVDEQGDHPAA